MTSLIKQHKTPLLTGVSSKVKRQEIKQYFENTWQTYESLFALINVKEAFYLRPEPLRHPLIFYYGHTATFYINKLMLGKYISKRVNEKLEAICAVGVDEMSWDDLNSAHYDWPTVEEVKGYRQQVYALIGSMIDDMPIDLPIAQNSLAWVILMGCEHERIHLETSSVIMRMLPLHSLSANDQWQACPFFGKAPTNELLPIQGKKVSLGKAADDMTYGWDNEYGEQTIRVDSFNVSKYLVSNQEFLAFINDGGYLNKDHWTDEGKQWLAFKQPKMPRFWLEYNNEYFQRNLLEEIPLPLNWPVEVNYLEAKAFCNWKSSQDKKHIRLPTEAEWQCLRERLSGDVVNWSEAPVNLNLEYFASSVPIDRFSTDGLYDICGNVWQWSESEIDGYNGFKVHPLYDDFSTPTFDGKHNLIKGGSWISTGNETIKSSRYAFRRHFFQHAGFRYIESEHADIPITKINLYETDPIICQQLACHYPKSGYLNCSENDKSSSSSSFVKQLSQYVKSIINSYSGKSQRILNLGCSVGGAAFELSSLFEYVDGVDFSARYIQYGVKLQREETVRYQSVIEGDIVSYNEVSLEKELLENKNNIVFSQGDAVNLKSAFTGYDLVLIQQALEQSYDPKQILKGIKNRINQDGLLVIASDYIFDSNITDKSKWLGGIKINGENVSGFDGLTYLLEENFKFLEQKMLTQVLRLNRYQSIQKQIDVTVWQLKND